jgi:hypothetical protein
VALANLDGDPALDLVIGRSINNTLAVGLNAGRGCPRESAYLSGRAVSALALADMNGDSSIDIVAATGSDTVAVFPNSRIGTFPTKETYQVPGATALALGDIDGRSGPDVVALSSTDDAARVLLNQGTGALALESMRYVGGRLLFGLALVPLQGGALDLILASATDDRLDILSSEGGARWGRSRTVQPTELAAPVAVTTADIDRDGRLDLIVPSHNNGRVLVLQNEGSYQFKVRSIAVGRKPIAVAALDLTGDGLPELAVLNAADNTLQVLFNATSVNAGTDMGDAPGFVGSAANTFPTGAQPVALAAGDLNSDGKPDLVVVHREAGLVKLLFSL